VSVVVNESNTLTGTVAESEEANTQIVSKSSSDDGFTAIRYTSASRNGSHVYTRTDSIPQLNTDETEDIIEWDDEFPVVSYKVVAGAGTGNPTVQRMGQIYPEIPKVPHDTGLRPGTDPVLAIVPLVAPPQLVTKDEMVVGVANSVNPPSHMGV
jgi:hypothetical protein